MLVSCSCCLKDVLPQPQFVPQKTEHRIIFSTWHPSYWISAWNEILLLVSKTRHLGFIPASVTFLHPVSWFPLSFSNLWTDPPDFPSEAWPTCSVLFQLFTIHTPLLLPALSAFVIVSKLAEPSPLQLAFPLVILVFGKSLITPILLSHPPPTRTFPWKDLLRASSVVFSFVKLSPTFPGRLGCFCLCFFSHSSWDVL